MAYVENFSGKMDWMSPFQRTGKFPLDRSSMFSSYEDALAYAKQDGSDLRGLGGTSYVGQIITVYGNDAGTYNEETGNTVYGTEIAAYIITGVGAEGAALQKLAQTTATGDFATDIANLQAALTALTERVKTLEDAEKVVDTNTTYTFTTATNTEGAIKVTAKDSVTGEESSSEVQVSGWATLIALANGRTTAYVYQNKEDETYIADIATKDKFKLGDLIYFRDANISDQWVSTIKESVTTEGEAWYLFTDLETDHPDLSGYLKTVDADNKYATTEAVSLKADKTTLDTLTTIVTENKTATDEAIATNTEAIEQLRTDLGKIDVSSQIDAKINELDVDQVGGGTGSYITSIKQVDGKIVANASSLPDYTDTYEAKGAAAQALTDAKAYSDENLVEAKRYVDTEVATVNTTISSVQSDAEALRATVLGHTDRIAKAEDTIVSHNNSINSINSTVITQGTSITNLTTKVELVESKVAKGVISEVQVGGVALEKDENNAVNIKSISTDLLTQGSQLLVLDCLNASLTDTTTNS